MTPHIRFCMRTVVGCALIAFINALTPLPAQAPFQQRYSTTTDQDEFVMGTEVYSPPSIPMPAKGVRFEDPNFHTTVLRFTDQAIDAYQGPGIQNEYAKADPENADGSLVILRGNTAYWYLYDRASAQLLQELTIFNDCNQEPEPRWDPNDPQRFFFLCQMSLRVYDVARDSVWIVRDFAADFPGAYAITTGSEGDASLFRNRWAFMVVDEGYQLMSVFVYDRGVNAILGRRDGGFPDKINWVGMSMSGNHCMVGYDDLLYPDAFSPDLSTSFSLPDGSNGHGDLAQTADGRDVHVYQNVATDYIAMTDLDSGEETPLVKIPFTTNYDIGLHVSGNCAATPGWVLISTYGAYDPPPERTHSWMDTQLFLVELKADPRIYRLAHTHAFTEQEYTGEKNYYAEAFAAINTSGTRVHFGSNWGDYRAEYSDSYIAELPENWALRLPGSTGIGVLPEDFRISVSVYPNPCADIATLVVTSAGRIQSPVDWIVFDALGRRVSNGTVVPGIDDAMRGRISLSGFASGLYFIRAFHQNQTASGRFVHISGR
jgi:hypothetical protein